MFQSLLSLLLASTLTLASFDSPAETESFNDKTLLSVSSFPVKQSEEEAPSLNAESVLAIDLDSKTIFYEKNSTKRVPIASLTKLMTAAIILEENDPNGIVIVSQNAAQAAGSDMGLFAGEKITVRNLLYGLLIVSGNDAALALAEHNAGSEAAFIEKMNRMAEKLGLKDTRYTNTTGLDSANAYSTARDVAILSSQLLKDDSIREIVKNSKAVVESVAGVPHELINTNILIGQLGIEGLKTGRTPEAGECLVVFAKSPNGHEVLSVILGSGNRFGETKMLLDWIYRAYLW